MSTPTAPWTTEQLAGDDVSKKDLVTWLQANGALTFQAEHKLKGTLKNVAKQKTKDSLIADYNALFESKAFKQAGEDEAAAAKAVVMKADADAKLAERVKKVSLSEDAPVEKPRYIKRILSKGDRTNYPQKGDTVFVFYTGKLPDGTVFDQNAISMKRGKKPQPLRLKLGAATVIRGWEEVLPTMSAGEKIELVVESVWAYGKKGLDNVIPPNTDLTFEMELCNIE